MKSKMKKLVSLVLAMAMVFTMSVTAFADEPATDTCDITISGAVEGSTYTAYKLMDVEVGTNANSETVYTYTVNDTYASILSSVLSSVQTGVADEDKVTDVVEYLDSISSDTAAVRTFADTVYTAIKTAEGSAALGTKDVDYYTTEATSSGATITGAAQGYYLIVETAAASSNDSISLVMLKTAGETTLTVATKEDVPEMTKKIKDINDSTDIAAGDWQDSADYDIGDDVPYKLTADLPSTLDSYDTYKMVFHDVMQKGLTFNADSVKVYADGVEVSTESYSVLTSENGNTNDLECTFEVLISDVKTIKPADSTNTISVTTSTVITVEYTAELNSNAIIGNNGNWNTAYLEYSNNPYNSGSGNNDTGETPTDTVVAFTYSLTINKVDSSGSALKGAAFKLTKYNKLKNTWEDVELTINTTTASDATIFIAKGLDDGVYKLEESTTPSGYNSIDPIYFKVEAGHVTDLDDTSLSESQKESPLTSLTYTQVSCTDAGVTSTYTDSDIVTFTIKDDSTFKEVDSVLTSIDVVNKKGSVLPSTGGIGTTIFYIVGAVLVLGAGVVLVTRRRTRA